MWYTLPWAFDEFFQEYRPSRSITKIQIFQAPSQTITTINQSSLRTLDTSGQTLPAPIFSLPYVALPDCIETLHLSFYNQPIRIHLSTLRTITLVNSINCLSYCSSFPPTVRSIRILLFHRSPNFMFPNWPQLSSLRIFMYDLIKVIDDESCQIIAKAAPMFRDFGFCFRKQFSLSYDEELIEIAFKGHKKFIKQLFDRILLLSSDKLPYYSIESDGCGLIMWF
jgi:hypothetical protein